MYEQETRIERIFEQQVIRIEKIYEKETRIERKFEFKNWTR